MYRNYRLVIGTALLTCTTLLNNMEKLCDLLSKNGISYMLMKYDTVGITNMENEISNKHFQWFIKINGLTNNKTKKRAVNKKLTYELIFDDTYNIQRMMGTMIKLINLYKSRCINRVEYDEE